jgi:hypothetical protein
VARLAALRRSVTLPAATQLEASVIPPLVSKSAADMGRDSSALVSPSKLSRYLSRNQYKVTGNGGH